MARYTNSRSNDTIFLFLHPYMIIVEDINIIIIHFTNIFITRTLLYFGYYIIII